MTGRRITRLSLVASVAAAAAAVAASSGLTPDGRAGGPRVLAASSLANALPAFDGAAGYEFGGSDRLMFQIEQGAPADVFVSADPAYIRALLQKGLLEAPRTVARNRLVVVVPRANPAAVHSVADLARPGVRVVLAAPAVPAGRYARAALRAAGHARALANVVSDEPDVRGVATKVALGEADAGVVYRTDALADPDRLTMVPLPPGAGPAVVYRAAVVRGGPDPDAGRRYVARLASPEGARALARFGFLPATSR